MRAAIFRSGDIVVDTIADPQPAMGQLLARTLACGICGSDLHAAGIARHLRQIQGDGLRRLGFGPTEQRGSLGLQVSPIDRTCFRWSPAIIFTLTVKCYPKGRESQNDDNAF